MMDQLTAKLASYIQQDCSTLDTEIMEAIYTSRHNNNPLSLNVYNSALSQVTGGSSDSEVQARCVGAIPGHSQEFAQDAGAMQESVHNGSGDEEEEGDDDDNDEADDEDDDEDNGDERENVLKATTSAGKTITIDITSSDSKESEDESDGEGTSGMQAPPLEEFDGDLSMRSTIVSDDDSSDCL
jgi:hypothetical protein